MASAILRPASSVDDISSTHLLTRGLPRGWRGTSTYSAPKYHLDSLCFPFLDCRCYLRYVHATYMPTQVEAEIQRWVDARIIDQGIAERIRTFERTSGEQTTRNWPMLVAVVFGALMLAAGILLFVAAHWEDMSPWSRFLLVMLMVSGLHVIGIFTGRRSPVLTTALHTIGTIACGAGIFLSGQIFNLQEHWPTGILLWAAGAWAAWALLRQWPQAALAAILTPAWLLGEWEEATKHFGNDFRVSLEGTLLLAIVYLAARSAESDSPLRKALNWIGALAFIPAYLILAFEGYETWYSRPHLATHVIVLGWTIALLGPLFVALLLRGKEAWPAAAAALWVVIFGRLPFHFRTADLPLGAYALHTLGPYLWGALGSVGLIGWGVRDRIKNRVNLGMVLFVVTLICFYFSDLLDKLGRSVSLISFGILFLVIGYFLEKTRKKLIAQIASAGA